MSGLLKLVDTLQQSVHTSRTLEVKLVAMRKLFATIRSMLDTPGAGRAHASQLALIYYKSARAVWLAFRERADKALLAPFETSTRRDLAVAFKLLVTDPIRFQLTYAKYDLYREHFGRVDARCEDFVPDAWQIELIDCIDASKSCIVIAPTSSGKTFASFYAFKRLLSDRADHDGMAVYVAPTKALVNQMLAGIYARFKRYSPPAGKQLVGVFTRDHQENVYDCKILLTVPECLGILYMSAEAQHELVPRIRHIVFDEFQCLNDDERASIWERVSLMCECPFLALSATISDPSMRRVLSSFYFSFNIKININLGLYNCRKYSRLAGNGSQVNIWSTHSSDARAH